MAKIDTFIGTKIGTLTVIGIHSKTIRWDKIYSVECSICSPDTELFPEIFKSSKSNLTKGQIPCGCSNTTRWTEYQNIIRIKRHCLKLGVFFFSRLGR